jgi:hypothetical protein
MRWDLIDVLCITLQDLDVVRFNFSKKYHGAKYESYNLINISTLIYDKKKLMHDYRLIF